MIPNQSRYKACYQHKSNGQTHYSNKPVIAWDENDGAALVADHKTGRLVDANSYSNFAGLVEADAPQVVAALPGNGWLAEYRDDDGATFTITVIAWTAKDDGGLEPACVDSTGFVSNPTEDANFVRLYHPGDEPLASEPST